MAGTLRLYAPALALAPRQPLQCPAKRPWQLLFCLDEALADVNALLCTDTMLSTRIDSSQLDWLHKFIAVDMQEATRYDAYYA
jgi:hypothetical protein